MSLSRLNNFLKNPKGEIIYVDPSSLDSTDSIENQGNSLTRPFKTLQRALIEAARFSYQVGKNNDRFSRTTIMLYPGVHYIDNRPGLIPIHDNPITGKNYLSRAGTATNNFEELSSTTNFDIDSQDNVLYKFNSVHGGVIIPRGCSIVGMDLRKTIIRPRYVPNPVNSQIERSAIFRVTGASYFWQFTFLDADPAGYCYKDYTNNTFIPNFSHHKLTAFEYADGVNGVSIDDDFITAYSTSRTDLEMYYEKIGLAFGPSSGRAITPDYPLTIDIEPKVDEFRIVGTPADSVGISSIRAGDGTSSTTTITVTLTTPSTVFQTDSPIRIQGINASGYNGQYIVKEVASTSEIKYVVQNPPLNPSPLISGTPTVTAVVDTVSSASPYIFNISLRSVFGMCGLHADGDKAAGFKSMVVAQFTGIGLQKDPNAFIKYDPVSGTYLDVTSPGNENINSDSKARYKPDYESFHIKASNDSILQLVSIFAIGYANHFVVESGGDLSLTNSNSNFGARALIAKGYKREAFLRDDVGYITHVIPPRELETDEITVEFLGIDVGVTTSVGFAATTRLYLYDQNNFDAPPNNVIQGYRFGARYDDKLFVTLLTPAGSDKYQTPILMQNTPGTGAEAVARKQFTVAANPTTGVPIIENNVLSLTSTHTFRTGESVRVLSSTGALPDGLAFNQLYYVIAGDTVPSLQVNQIKLAQTVNEAIQDSAIKIYARGGLLTVESRVSDKAPGELGHPIQWDSTIGQWYVTTSDGADNQIYPILKQYGINSLGKTTPKTFLRRRPDPRPLNDTIFRIRYVVPKDSPIKGRPPLDGYILQETNSTLPGSITEIQKYFGTTYSELTSSTELRSPKFIAYAQFLNISTPSVPNVTLIVTEQPHNLQYGSYVEIRNIKSLYNPTGEFNQGFNGKFFVYAAYNRKSFVISLANDPGQFISNTAVRDTSLPYYKRKKFLGTYVVYRTEEIQEYIQNEKDGIYYLIVTDSSTSPSVSPFREGSASFDIFGNQLTTDITTASGTPNKFLQPIQYLYPQTNRDNPQSDPPNTVSYALPDPIGQVVINNPEHSLTKEGLAKASLDFNVGIGLTDIVSAFDGFSVSQYNHTLYTRFEHGYNRATSAAILYPGYNYGFGVAGSLYNARLVGITSTAIGVEATAAINVDSSGSVTGITIMDGGSAYKVGDLCAVVGVVTAAGSGLGVWVPAVVQITNIYDNRGDTLGIQGVFPPVYDGYNTLYKIIDVPSPTSLTVKSSSPVSAANPLGIGATFTFYTLLQNNATSIKIQKLTYNNVSGIATITTSDRHQLAIDNKVRLGGFDVALLNKDYIVKKINSPTSFNIKVGVSTVGFDTGGTDLTGYRGGFGANGGPLGKEKERISARLVTEYSGISTVISSPITDTTSTEVYIENVNRFDFKLGDYLQIDDEIIRIKAAPGIGSMISNPVQIFRGLMGSKRQTHPVGSGIKRIFIRPSEFRRHSIIRASGHTFEYVGFGPGNYSSSLPQYQDRELKPSEDLLSKTLRVNGGINVFTGMNNDGAFYIGNKRVSSATGQQEIFDAPVPTVTGEDIGGALGGVNIGFDLINPLEAKIERSIRVDGGSDGKVVSEFNGPVIFNNTIISNTDNGIRVRDIVLQGSSETTQKISVGISTPTVSGDYGDITFTDNPISGGYIGWVYTINNTWERFGPIQATDRYVGVWSGIGTQPSFFGDGSGLYNVSDIWKLDPIGIHTTRKIGVGTDFAKSGITMFVNGAFEANGISTFSNTTQSTSKSTGALVVKGGVGIGSNLYVGGDFKVSGITTLAGTTYINGVLSVYPHADVEELYVSGVSTFQGNANIQGYTNANSGLTVAGITTFNSNVFFGPVAYRPLISSYAIIFGV
jgi:hypothetical protein